MVRAVLPKATSRNVWLLTGYAGTVPCCTGRAAPLTEEIVGTEPGGEADGRSDEEEAGSVQGEV